MTPDLPGVYRGEVRSSVSKDPEGRLRVRVYVPFIHASGTPEAVLPLAELCQDVGQLRGKFFAYRPGDAVWVAFEGGEPDKAVIVGGQITAPNGVSDVPVEMQLDQNDALVVESDDAGNVVIRDGRLDKRCLIFRSGGAEVHLTANGDRVTLRSVSGSVRVEAANVTVNASTASVQAHRVDIDATSTDVFSQEDGAISERANDTIVRNAVSSLAATGNADAIHGSISDGGEVPKVRGVPSPPGRPLQTNKHNLRARVINIGVGPTGFNMDSETGDPALSSFIDYDPNVAEATASAAGGTPSVPYPLNPTLEINIRSSSVVSVAAPSVVIGAATEIKLLSQANVTVTALADLSVTAEGKATVDVGGTADVTIGGAATVDIGGSADVTVVGKVTLDAAGDVEATVGGKVVAQVVGNLEATVGGSANLTISGNLTAFVGGSATLTAGSLSMTGATIDLTGVVTINGPLTMFGPLIGMTGVSLDVHQHPFLDNTTGGPVPNTTFPPI